MWNYTCLLKTSRRLSGVNRTGSHLKPRSETHELYSVSTQKSKNWSCCFAYWSSLTLFSPGFNMRLWRSDHKWTALNTSENDHQDALWSHIFCSVHANASCCVPRQGHNRKICHQCRSWSLFWWQRANARKNGEEHWCTWLECKWDQMPNHNCTRRPLTF